jgi:hypothetical protein
MAIALFKPQAASFGELVLRPRGHGLRDFARWSPAAEDEDTRRARNHLFIALGFVTAFVTLLSGIYVADSAIYPHPSAKVAAHAAPVDYD